MKGKGKKKKWKSSFTGVFSHLRVAGITDGGRRGAGERLRARGKRKEGGKRREKRNTRSADFSLFREPELTPTPRREEKRRKRNAAQRRS